MAWGNGKRGGERVLESRHLVGLFLGVVLLCGVFFTLGYVMGRTQYGGAVHAADVAAREPAPAPAEPVAKLTDPQAAPPPASNEWDFYSKKDDNHLVPPLKSGANSASPAVRRSAGESLAASRPVSEPLTKPPARFQPPRMLKGSVVLQLAALRRESDALAMADAVQQKRFPAFVVTPTSDNLYRVQVGPYRDDRAAEAARVQLERAGFKAILKR